MSPKPQQRTTPQQRTPSSSRTPARAPSRASARAGTDDFAQLMRANTVDVGRTARRRSPAVGKVAFALAVASVAVDASAFAVFMGGDGTFAVGICFVVVFLTFIAAVMGFIAAVGGLGRWYGVGGVLIGFAANPVVVIVVLVFVAPDMAREFGA